LVGKRKTLTTKAQRHQGNTHREDREGREESQACRGDLALIPHLSSIIRNSNREDGEGREERFHHKGTEDTEEEKAN
jgi:hypothetical protein